MNWKIIFAASLTLGLLTACSDSDNSGNANSQVSEVSEAEETAASTENGDTSKTTDKSKSTFTANEQSGSAKVLWAELAGAELVDAALKSAQQAGGEEEISEIADAIYSEVSGEEVVNLSGNLYHRDNGDKAARLAVLLAEKAHDESKASWAIARLAFASMTGFGAEKDYERATRLFNEPILAQTPFGLYGRGRILVENDNPERDIERGKELLQRAAEGGFEQAEGLLDSIDGNR